MKPFPEGFARYSKEPAQAVNENEPISLPIGSNEVQMALMRMTMDLTNPENPYGPWLTPHEGISLAERFRTYVESPDHKNEQINIENADEVAALMSGIEQTMH